jgi:hypothetical protein
MINCEFVVNERGRRKVVETKRKNVHAFVRGETTLIWPLGQGNWLEKVNVPVDKWEEVSYNPYRFGTFVHGKLNWPAIRAEKVMVINNKVYAQGINRGV